jgi:hypothetical protein
MAKIEAANALRRLTDHPQDFGFALKPDDPRVVAAEKLLAMETDKFERLKSLQERRATQWQAASAALAACEAWLKSGMPGGTTLEDAEEVQPQLPKGESVIEGVERLRRRCRELKADLHRITSAPYPSGYCKARAKEQIEALAMQGAPIVSNVVEHDGDLIWPMTSLRSEVLGGELPSLAFAEIFNPVALACWLHRDLLIKRLDDEINAEADDAAALTHEARQRAGAEVQGDLLDIERQEAALVWQAQQQGLPVEHRGDCSPQAILGAALRTLPRADALPPTTPGQSWTVRR